jgi:sec-independent protein translocase protein TatC
MKDNEEYPTVWEHVGELRQIFIKCAAAVLIGVFCCFLFHREILGILTSQIANVLDSNQLVILGPLDGISSALKISGWAGLVLSSPVWLFFVFKFIQPALNPTERKLILPFFGLSFVFMSLGACLGFFIIIPIANNYLEAFNSEIGTNLWSLSQYLQFTLFLLLANALSFELSVIFFILVHYELISSNTMVAKRRHVVVLAFILGALLTPPDILTQLALAIPFIGLYETAILYSKFRRWIYKEKRLCDY